jgi:outer membrane receptor protein involved in Fe transport
MDYGNVHGIELNLESINTRSYNFMFNYTYAFANGRASSVFRSNGEIVPRRLDPLDWDLRHKFNLNLMIRSTGWADRYIGDAEVDFLVVVHSGYPYTSNVKAAFPLFIPRNDGRLPWYKNVDMRIRKSFTLVQVHLALLAEVKNLFDWRNISFISGGTDGIALFEATGDPRGPYGNPSAYDPPRLYRLGVEIQF